MPLPLIPIAIASGGYIAGDVLTKWIAAGDGSPPPTIGLPSVTNYTTLLFVGVGAIGAIYIYNKVKK